MSQIKGAFRALLKAISKLSISKKKNQEPKSATSSN